MIRFANRQDVDAIMQFINSYWKNGHILATNKEFFEYEHCKDDEVTYVVSENEDGGIDAILGYIPYGKHNRDAMTVMWKVNHTNNPTLGIEMFNYLRENADIRILASPGSNKKLRGLYSYMGYKFGKMNHWYRLNNLNEYKIAKILDDYIPQNAIKDCTYVKFNTWEELEARFDFDIYYKSNPKPLKESWYIKKRYFNHPIYSYDVYGLEGQDGIIKTLLVFRKINLEESAVIRLIDCIGEFEQIKYATGLLDDLLRRSDAEYVDCYESGLQPNVLSDAGWIKREDTENIIPNYFSPFVQENIEIYYFTTDEEIVLFKGDGDQDRPN